MTGVVDPKVLAWKRHVWDFLPITMPGEGDRMERGVHWSPLMALVLDFFGESLVWSIGIEVLGYPPTMVDTFAEAQIVERAAIKFAMQSKTQNM